jgi:predicted ATP-grasp superfamily ATP-dependent carboligase
LAEPNAPPPREPILLAAVSARMLAALAVDAGHRVVALDRFGDLDLRQLCDGVSLQRDLGGRGGLAALVDAAQGIEAPSVVYGAGFENHPDLVARLAQRRTLLGNPPLTLRRVRDPAVLGACLRDGGFAYPRTLEPAAAPAQADRSRRWLRKPLRGGAGRGVREWRGGRLSGAVVVQERVAGVSCSAGAVADGRRSVLLGLSEQLVGRRALGVRGYTWCGNLVPPRLPPGERSALLDQARAVCDHLAGAFGLRGLFGVDLVWDGSLAWVVEVNPRPCASLEPIEAAHELGAFRAHLASFEGGLAAPDLERLWSERPAAGKAVVFATEALAVDDTRRWPQQGIRDVPHPGERIARGHPICTLVAVEETPEDVLAVLDERAARLRAGLHRRAEIHVGV